jgi:hypothetical protein
MVIFVPLGDTEDPTRDPEEFDDVYRHLVRCGVRNLPVPDPTDLIGALRGTLRISRDILSTGVHWHASDAPEE